MSAPGPAPLLAMSGISKSFGAVRANQAVDLTVRAGDVVGLLGENGAGKTTLMNILFGAYAADDGEIQVDGRPVTISSPADALALGIGMVHQHFHLVPSHTVLENLMVGQKGRAGRLDVSGARARLGEIAERYGLALNGDALVGDLAIGEQQRLEIVKALYHGARILILDEPTAVLTPQEADGLFQALRTMVAAGGEGADGEGSGGMGIIFISHKLHEVRALTNRIVVMRRGEVAAALEDVAGVSDRQLAELMCGREVTPPVRPQATAGDPLLALSQINTGGNGRSRLKDLSLEVLGGRILGIAGVSGNGQGELANVIAGVLKPVSGQVRVGGQPVPRPSPRAMQRLGVGRIPEDRIGTGLLTSLPLTDSMVLPFVHRPPFSRFGLLDLGAIKSFVEAQIERFAIKADGAETRTGTLSGGNLQKALLARELSIDPLVLLAAQPTRGLDVAAAGFVHELFLDLRARGRAIVLISEDLEELFLLSDEIAVIYEGRITDPIPIEQATVRQIGLLMTGAEGTA
jgi:simple sugar transport system ATP-binding protein